MAQITEQPSPDLAHPTSTGERSVARWHAGWFAATAIAAVACVATRLGSGPAVGLAVASVAGGAGAILSRRRGVGEDARLLLVWAASVTVAVLVTGGLSGPLAVLTLAPLAAACALGGRRNLAIGAALAVVAAAVIALADAATSPARAHQPWLAAFILALTGGGLATAIVLAARRSGARLRASSAAEARLRRILDRQNYLVLDLTQDGQVRESFGRSFLSFADGSLAAGFELLGDRSEVLQAALALARLEGRAEVGFQPADDADRWIAATLTADDDGFVAVLRDATLARSRERFLERTAAQAEALNEGKSRFLANMSHELRTPLNAVVGFSDIMRSQMFGPLAPRYAEYAELIHESGGHLLDLINDVLDLSKIEAERYELSLEDFDARDAVTAALRLVRVQADASGVKLRGVLGPERIPVRADRRALKQIVLNLVSNALKFTPAGGAVTVGLRAADGGLELVVGDTGVGIPPNDLERLGSPYEQAGDSKQKARGSGLGLSLVRALSALHGGEMSIQSTLGAGTIVAVQLPVIKEPAAGSDPRPPHLADNVIAFNPSR